MLKLIEYYNNLLIKKEKKNLYIIFIFGTIASVIDTLSIGILPLYLLSITDLESFIKFSPNFLKDIIISFEYQNKLILASSLTIILLFLIKNIFLYLLNIFIMFLFLSIREGIMFRSAKHFIYISYQTFLKFNSANIIRNITGESLNTSNCLRDIILLFQEISLVLFIVIFSSILYPEITLPGIVIIFSVSLFFFFITKKYLKKLGAKNVELRANFIKSVNHVFGSFKEIKIFKNENYMLDFFRKSLSNEISNIKRINIVSTIPRYLIEIFVITLILLLLTFFLFKDRSIQNHIPMLTLFASALIRIMPSVIKINQIFSKITTTYKSVEVINDLKLLDIKEKIFKLSNEKKFQFNNEIIFKNVNFKYLKSRENVFNNLNFRIKKNSLNLITGVSGSGKSTLIELITGILKPDEGKIYVDNRDISENISSWQDHISYMPQEIYLLDDTIKENIIFDFNVDNNKDDLDEVLKKVNLYNFIQKLPNKYEEKLGERANLFSGGQIKRFGLARCLIKKRPVIILDEPTTGLDKENVSNLIKSIKKISEENTVIIVSHNNEFEKVADFVLNLSKIKI